VFAIAPGTYQIVVSHRSTISVSSRWSRSCRAVPGAQMLTASVVPVVDTTGYISGDFQRPHAEQPDSIVSNRDRIVTMLAEGVDFSRQ